MGKPLSAETKKKISEALKKKFGNNTPAMPVKKQTALGKMRDDFDNSKRVSDRILGTIGQIKANMKGATKESKEKMKQTIKELRQKIKEEQVRRKAILQAAKIEKAKQRAAKRIAIAQQKIAKAQANLKKLDGLTAKANQLLMSAKNSTQVERAKKILAGIKERQSSTAKHIKENTERIKEQTVVAKTGIEKKKRLFSERIPCFFQEKVFNPWRQLTVIEQKTNFIFLNDQFNSLEAQLAKDLSVVIGEDIQKNIKKIEGKIKAGDIAAIAAMTFLSYDRVYAIISAFLKKALEVGKKTASEEIKVEMPATPTKTTQLNNFTAGQITDDFINGVNSEAKKKAKSGLAKEVAAIAIVGAVNEVVKKKADSFIDEIAGSLISTGINDGRRLVYEKHVNEIQGYERSEILDDRTCNICASLDGRQVRYNDAMAQIDQIHNNCRGVWIPILLNEETSGEWGVPSKVRNAFDTQNRFGLPETNNFKQLKKPITE